MPAPSLSRELRQCPDDKLDDRLRNEVEACSGDTAELTTYLLDAIKIGSLPPDYFDRYCRVNCHPNVVVAGLRQTDSFFVRSAAINHLHPLLRSRDSFSQLWAALGGAAGIASIMAELSVVHVQAFCRALASTASFPESRLERQQGLSELLGLLWPLDDSVSGRETRDLRPLQAAYKALVKGCTLEVTRRWIDSNKCWTPNDDKMFYRVHGEAWREQELRKIFPTVEGQLVRLDPIRPYLPEDRKFTAHVLRRIVQHPDTALKVDVSELAGELMLPLLRYIHRRSPPHDFRDRVWNLIEAALERWPGLVEQLASFESGSLVWLAVQTWTWADAAGDVERKRRIWLLVDRLLQRVLKLKKLDLEDFPRFLRVCKLEDRFELLKYLIRHQEQYGFDISYPTSAENLALVSKLKAKIPYRLFNMIPPQGAIQFLDLLDEAQPPNVHIQKHSQRGVMGLSAEFEGSDIDAMALRSVILQAEGLEERRSSFLPLVHEEVQKRIVTSTRSRDVALRKFWAVSALHLSIASGSLDMYSDTLHWARRFKGDHHVSKAIQAEYSMPTLHALNLLGGLYPNTPLHALRETIEKGNKIALSSLEVAIDNREPTAPPLADLWGHRKLACDVAVNRLDHIDRFQKRHSLSDAAVFDLVWRPTITLLIEAERIALDAFQGELGHQHMHGVLTFDCYEKPELPDCAWRFLDELCKARDELWHKERVRRSPAVLTLSDPWPKGLPLRLLLPTFFTNAAYHDTDRYQQRFDGDVDVKLPYAFSRANAIVFMNPEHLLEHIPEDQETVCAIQGFVEDYALAVEVVVFGQAANQKETAAKIWQHCVRNLSAGRLTDTEAMYFWRRWVFGGAKAFEGLPSPTRQATPKPEAVTRFPEWDPEGGPVPWDPSPPVVEVAVDNSQPWIEAEKTLCSTSIWHMLRVSVLHSKAHPSSLKAYFGGYQKEKPHPVRTKTIPASPENTQPWTLETFDSPLAKEMLTNNAKYGTDNKFLKKPFPSPDDVRYPAMYLADEFLESKGFLLNTWHMGELESGIQRVPVDLLLQLASSVFTKVKSSKHVDSNLTWACMLLIKLVGMSDRPSLVSGFVKELVLERPEDTSWHRHVFCHGVITRLSASDAKGLLLDLAHSIIDRLQTQEQYTAEERKKMANPPPIIKVTVVKMLAQAMRGATFIDQQTALDVLVAILDNAKHVDIRAAAVSVLVDYFVNAAPDTDTSAIIRTLETHVVPIAASFLERYPINEERWVEHEENGEMPEVAPFTAVERPMYEQLAAATEVQLRRPKWKGKWRDSLLAKVIEQSTINNTRWMALFLKLNKLSLAEGEVLPPVPINLSCIELELSEVSSGDDIPLEALEKVNQLVAAMICNKPTSVTEAVKHSKKLAKSNGGKHWLYTWDGSSDSSITSGITALFASKLSNPAFSPSGASGMATIKDIQDFFLSLADAFIAASDHTALRMLASRLIQFQVHSGKYDLARHKTWKSNILPVLGQIVERIETIRSDREWQRNPERVPVSLPNTFEIRLEILRKMWGTVKHSEFAQRIKVLLGAVVGNGPKAPYHREWELLKGAVLGLDQGGDGAAFLNLAWELGNGLVLGVSSEQGLESEQDPENEGLEGGGRDKKSEITLEEYLVVELVLELIRGARSRKDVKVVKKLKGMIDGWVMSEDEMVREGARKVLGLLKV
ncbi:hypothetical protein QBC42DRAFT_325950 [Cladorrhinum samala]|uniref:Uncharacterized protein n=1 Tax=Cladorrhinum samala TaxID=585594 RepID=A0AAV9HQ94_9PEZI|nr:hypothetical protein QBC42DRAFT_325950 [Cladorrhinum samala]